MKRPHPANIETQMLYGKTQSMGIVTKKRQLAECDCCGKPGTLTRCIVAGIETFACEECRS